MTHTSVQPLLDFIAASPSCYHVVSNRRSIRYNVYLHDTIYVILFHFRKGGGAVVPAERSVQIYETDR